MLDSTHTNINEVDMKVSAAVPTGSTLQVDLITGGTDHWYDCSGQVPVAANGTAKCPTTTGGTQTVSAVSNLRVVIAQ